MDRLKRSLNLKINVLMTLVVMVFFSVFGTVDYIKNRRIRTEELNEYLTVATERLAHTLQVPVWDLDYTRLEEPVNAEMQNRNLHTIVVVDAITGIPLIGKTRGAGWELKDTNKPVSGVAMSKTEEIRYNDKLIGEITVQVTDRFVKEDIVSSAFIQARTVALLMLTFITVLSVTIFIAVLMPIRKLTTSVRAITSGNIEEPIEAARNDELGELASDFSLMRDTIKQKIDDQNNEISERRKVEHELRHLQNYLTNIIDSMPSVLVGVDAKGNVTQWNKRAELGTGIPAATAHGQSFGKVFNRMDVEMDTILESIQSGTARYDKRKRQVSEQVTVYEDITIYPLIENGVEGAVIRIDDVSDKVRMEEVMIQSEKMLSVGGLAAGMAHEINNPLAGMMQTANVMTTRLSAGKEIPANITAAKVAGIDLAGLRVFMSERGILRMLETINDSGRRIADIVNNMLSFARKSESVFLPLNIATVLDRTLELAATDYNLKKHYDFKQIRLSKEYQKGVPEVYCEEAKIQQVLLNILRNGAQAMQEAKTECPAFTLRIYTDKSRSMTCVDIEDSGPGMPEEVRKRVFEPFFTTKPVGIGTGLGLSVAYFIITENHGGELSVESTIGSGARFIMKFPAGKNCLESDKNTRSKTYD